MMPMEGLHQWPMDPRKPKPPAYVKMPGQAKKREKKRIK
jgi:hypothetical protein